MQMVLPTIWLEGNKIAAFARNQLTSLTLPDSITSIDDWAFTSNFDLSTVIIPDSINIENLGREIFGDDNSHLYNLKIVCKGSELSLANESQCNSTNYYWNGRTCNYEPDPDSRICEYNDTGYIKVGNYCASPEVTYAKKHYTPAEANQWLKDDDNTVVLTFKK